MTDPVLSSLVRINRQRIRDLRRRLAPCGYLGVMHLIVLYVRRHPGARQEDVACFYAVDKTSVARDARRLEDMGAVTIRTPARPCSFTLAMKVMSTSWANT